MGAVPFTNGQEGSVVLVGPRENPKGATVVFRGGEDKLESVPFLEALELLHPEAVIDAVCMQERVFGNRGLESPFEPRSQW